MKKEQTEGMKTTPSGGANAPKFGQDIQPTNGSLVSKLGSMLSAIKHPSKPVVGGKMPFAK